MEICDCDIGVRILSAGISVINKKGGGKVKKVRKILSASMCFLFGICIWNNQILVSQAEEITPPGYHVYTTTEDEVIDTWYGIAKGTYLQSGTVGLVEEGKGKVNISGSTDAHSICDKVKVAVYLDQSINGKTGYGTIGSYYYSESNSTSCYGTESNISVTSGWWYMVRGVHTVIEGSTTETTSTQTSGMKVS